MGFKLLIFWKIPHFVPENMSALLPDLELLLTELISQPFPLLHPLIPFSKPELLSKFFTGKFPLPLAEISFPPTSVSDKLSNQVFPVAPATYLSNAILTEVFSGPVLKVVLT